jgi:hypothetical protein
MSTASPAVRALAGRLIAIEAARDDPLAAPAGVAVRVCEKLRLPLTKLIGIAGFRSLLSRALEMAKAEVPPLGAVQVRADGSMAGFAPALQDQAGGLAADGDAVVTRLLGLLMTFIGEPLTLQLMREAWPDVPVGGSDRGGGEER